MGKQENFKTRISRIFDLPQDVILNLPKLSLTGNLDLVIENHRGIIKYTTESVKIRVYHGQVIVGGAELMIESIESDILAVTGQIADLSFKLD